MIRTPNEPDAASDEDGTTFNGWRSLAERGSRTYESLVTRALVSSEAEQAGSIPQREIAQPVTAEDEAFYILDGELEFLDGTPTFIGRQVDFVFIPRGRRHKFKNITDMPVTTLFLFTPASPEDLFVEGATT